MRDTESEAHYESGRWRALKPGSLTSAFSLLSTLVFVGPLGYELESIPIERDSAQPTSARPTIRQPLFESHDVLHVTIETDLEDVKRDIGEDRKEHPARLSYTDPNRGLVVLEATVKTRGKFRRDWRICEFPPLRIDLKKRRFPDEEMVGTLFENQNELKMVCHCQDYRDEYEQFVLKEYLAYRIYQLFTDLSFSVRLARVTYVDAASDRDSITRYAFFIEDEKKMAERNGAVVLDSLGVSQLHLDDEYATLFSFFQYFIGNTDWKVSALHNVKLLQLGARFPIAVPYDFDWAGLVEPPYAAPHPDLRTRDLRERVFISPCRTEYDVKRVIQMFNDRKEAIYALDAQLPLLGNRSRTRIRSYMDDFFELVDDPRAVRREFLRNCPGS